MLKVLRIICTFMLFAAMMIAPGHGAMDSVSDSRMSKRFALNLDQIEGKLGHSRQLCALSRIPT